MPFKLFLILSKKTNKQTTTQYASQNNFTILIIYFLQIPKKPKPSS